MMGSMDKQPCNSVKMTCCSQAESKSSERVTGNELTHMLPQLGHGQSPSLKSPAQTTVYSQRFPGKESQSLVLHCLEQRTRAHVVRCTAQPA